MPRLRLAAMRLAWASLASSIVLAASAACSATTLAFSSGVWRLQPIGPFCALELLAALGLTNIFKRSDAGGMRLYGEPGRVQDEGPSAEGADK